MNQSENEKSAYNLKQNFTMVKQILENSLEGFCPRDEKFFKEHIRKNIEEFLKCLRDPRLPLIEFREVLAAGIFDIVFYTALCVIFLILVSLENVKNVFWVVVPSLPVKINYYLL